MLENILLIIAGFFLLIKGSEILVDGSSNIAKKIHISQIVIGLTVVAIGTSLPELIICIKSALNNSSDIEIGTIIGSDICNLFFVLGVCSFISPIVFKKETKLFEIPISLVMIFTFFILANNSGINKSINRYEGIILVVLFVLYLAFTIFIAKYGEILDPKVELITDEDDIGILKSLFFIIIGIVALNFGGDFVVDNVLELIEKFRLNEKVLSLTVIAFGTSLPELITSITAIFKKQDEIAVGNILGSNIFNLLLISGVSSIISTIEYSVDFNVYILLLFIITACLLIIPNLNKKKDYIGKISGALFVLLYITYIVSIFIRQI